MLNWWKDYGGDFNELLRITNLGIKAGQPGKAKALTGSLGIAVETAIATATPVTASLIALLKNIGVEAVKGSADALAKAGKDALTNALNKGQTLPGVETALVIETPKPESSAEVPKAKADKTADDVPPVVTDDTKKSNMPLILGGIAVLGLGAYFLMKKK